MKCFNPDFEEDFRRAVEIDDASCIYDKDGRGDASRSVPEAEGYVGEERGEVLNADSCMTPCFNTSRDSSNKDSSET